MPYARITDPTTSHMAAKSVSNVERTKAMIYKLLQIMPMTDQDLVLYYQQQIAMGADPYDCPRASESGIRSRRAELVSEGMVEDTGARLKTASGRLAVVWRSVVIEGC